MKHYHLFTLLLSDFIFNYSKKKILKAEIHEFDTTYKYLQVFVEDDYITIKNLVNFNYNYNGKAIYMSFSLK